jgi:glycosyltransferase involved in cell wall biosynthesis
MDKPLVSIVLPVYNAGVYLKEAIQSILDQTYTNFELIIINDGSTDDSEKLIKSFTDDRIRYIYQQNTGLAGALNTGLQASIGKYIARQDQDDISLKERLQKQVEFLEKHPNVNLLGTRAQVFTDDQKEMKMHDHATEPAVLRFDLLFDNPFVHSSVMFRKESIDKIGYYNTDRSYYEDFELWSRFAFNGRVANLREV